MRNDSNNVTKENKRNYRIAIIGSDEDIIPLEDREVLYSKCAELGKRLAYNNFVVFSGGDQGIGYEVIKSVYNSGGTTLSFFPGKEGDHSIDYVTIPIFSEMGYGVRDILMLRSVEGIISIGGGAGTLGELANGYNLRRPIIVLDWIDGWSNEIPTPYLDSRNKSIIIRTSDIEDTINILKAKIDKRRKFFSLMKENKFNKK